MVCNLRSIVIVANPVFFSMFIAVNHASAEVTKDVAPGPLNEMPVIDGTTLFALIIIALIILIVIIPKTRRYCRAFIEKRGFVLLFLSGLVAFLKSVATIFKIEFINNILGDDDTTILATFGLLSMGVAYQYGISIPRRNNELDDKINNLREHITRAIDARKLEGAGRLWSYVLRDAMDAEKSVNTFITSPDYEEPVSWRENLPKQFAEHKKNRGKEVQYRLRVFRPTKDTTDADKETLKQMETRYTAKGLTGVSFKFVPCENYLGLNIAVIDGKHAAIIWDEVGGDNTTTGVYFENDPEVAGKLDSWYTNYVTNLRTPG